MYKIDLNSDVATHFRNTINEYINLSMKHEYKHRNKKLENSWNSICSIMDRIDDLVYYLNQKELNNGLWKNCAFDFFEFIEQAGVLVSCIDDAFAIYNVQFPHHNVIFKSKKLNPNVTITKNTYELDDSYFMYIRSLSSVHPSDTSHHKEFQEANFEVSPYVVWNKGVLTLNNPNADLVLVSYNNETSDFLTNKGVIIDEIFNYIKYKYYSLNYLSKKIAIHYKQIIANFRLSKIKKSPEFGDYVKYLNNLKEEALKRNPDMECEIQELIDILNLKITNNNNEIKFEKYKNALKYAIQSFHRQLQNMDFNCRSPFDRLIGELLLGEIYFKDDNYHYPLSKILYLKESTGDKNFGLSMYKCLLSVFEKYVDVSEDDLYQLDYYELYVLSQIALYFHALDYDNDISRYIPNQDMYR